MTDTRPILDLTYVSGRFCIGVTELDERGYGVRGYVLATQEHGTVTRVMMRRFDDMARLMGDNVQTRKDVWLTEGEAADEADHRNADEDFVNQAWQTAFVNDGDEGYWTVTLA